MPENKDSENLIGIDYGDTNIGVALGRAGYVTPLEVITTHDAGTAINKIARLAIENKVNTFIVGLATTESGKETHQSLETRKFAKLLKIMTKKPIKFVSEYASSKDAHAEREFFGASTSRKALQDHIAAAVILKRYFDENL